MSGTNNRVTMICYSDGSCEFVVPEPAIHLIVLLVGSKVTNMFLLRNNDEVIFPIDIDSAMVASNAAVGGAATAASYASMIGRQDLVFSASVVGILGYTIGTPLGTNNFR